MAPRHSMFKHKPPVDRHESKGLFFKAVYFGDTQTIARDIKLYV